MKYNNIHIVGVSEGEESKLGIEKLFEEIMAENFPNPVNEKVIDVLEVESQRDSHQDTS